MLKKVQHTNMGRSDLGWLKSLFHFSFADYYNPNNMGFGVVRVINDDLVEAGHGFDMHHHRDMEIISYVVDGELTHGDNMGNQNTISRGHVQYMSAGTGVFHSEHNLGDKIARFIQIWILPDQTGHTPSYGDFKFEWKLRKNKWFHIVSSKEGNAPIKINQDVNFYLLELDQDQQISFPIRENRQGYLVQIEGISTINEINLNTRDAMEVIEEEILIKANETSHFLLIEMKKE